MLTLRRKERLLILTLDHRELGMEWKTKPSVGRKNKITKIRAEINEIETKKTTEKTNEAKGWFFGRINKDKLLAVFTKRKRESTKIEL